MTIQPDHNGPSSLPRNVLTAIHAAKRELGWDGDEYRAVLKRITGYESCVDIEIDQIPDLQREFRRRRQVTHQRERATLAQSLNRQVKRRRDAHHLKGDIGTTTGGLFTHLFRNVD